MSEPKKSPAKGYFWSGLGIYVIWAVSIGFGEFGPATVGAVGLIGLGAFAVYTMSGRRPNP